MVQDFISGSNDPVEGPDSIRLENAWNGRLLISKRIRALDFAITDEQIPLLCGESFHL